MSSERASNDVAIRLGAVGKCYHIYSRPKDRLLQTLLRGRRRFYEEFWALRDVSLEIAKGECVGIVGRNGSGKSTLLQIIAGTLQPSTGDVSVQGRVGALLELGSGFNPEYSGRENVYMLGAILGLRRREVEERFDDIARFADIGEFLERPVKTYSTGMFVRLAFAVQAQLRPEVLIIDEALAVGDALFQKRCYAKLEELRGAGVTFLFVSHDQEAIRSLTSRALLLEQGCVRAEGSPAEVLLEYRSLLHEQETSYYRATLGRGAPGGAAAPSSPSARESAAERRLAFGDLDAELEALELLDAAGREALIFAPGEPMRFRVRVRVLRELTHMNVFLRLRSKEGFKIYSWGTLNQDIAIWSGRASGEVFWERVFRAGEVITVDFECECRLGANWYEVQGGVSEEEDRFYGAQRMLHWRDELAFFQVSMAWREYFFGGMCDLQMKAHVAS